MFSYLKREVDLGSGERQFQPLLDSGGNFPDLPRSPSTTSENPIAELQNGYYSEDSNSLTFNP